MHVCQGTSNKTSVIKCLVNISILLKLSLIKHTECTKQYAPLLIAAHTFLSGQNRLKPCEKEFRATTDIVQESAPRNAVKIISVPRNRATKSEKFIFDLEGACKIRLRNGSRGSLSIKCMFLCRFIRPIYFSTWHLKSKKNPTIYWPQLEFSRYFIFILLRGLGIKNAIKYVIKIKSNFEPHLIYKNYKWLYKELKPKGQMNLQ